jgi:hypothetical protein
VHWLPSVLLVLGGLLRLYAYLRNPPLRWDEAALALNVINRSAAQLLQPLDYSQTAPFGYLMLEKLALAVAGAGEPALRAVSVIASLASLLLFLAVARTLLPPVSAAVGMALFALSGRIIQHSAEVKQYSTDVLVSLLLVAAALRLHDSLERRAVSRRSWLALGLFGAAGIWFSHPATFTLAGIGASLLTHAVRSRNSRALRSLFPVASLWLLSFLGFYFVSLRTSIHDEFLQTFWSGHGPGAPARGAFMPLPPRSITDLLWFPGTLRTSLRLLATLPSVWIVALAFIVGLSPRGHRHRRSVCLCVLPLVFALAASGLRQFPFSGRLILFAAPALALLTGAGVGRIIAWFRLRTGPGPGVLFALLFVLYPLGTSLRPVPRPAQASEIRSALTYFLAHRSPGDTLYVYYGAEAPFLYYAPRLGIDPDDCVLGVTSRDDWSAYERDLDALRSHRRVWVLFGNSLPDERSFFLEVLDRAGARIDAFADVSTELFLYELSD